MELVEIKDLVTAGKRKQMAAAVQGALDAGATPDDILNCMVGAMGDVGEMFSRGEIFVPEMLMSAKAMSAGMDVIKPLLAGEGAENSGECKHVVYLVREIAPSGPDYCRTCLLGKLRHDLRSRVCHREKYRILSH